MKKVNGTRYPERGDRAGEAIALSNIGAVYNALGEKQKALDYYQQSLPLSRAVGDHAGEATTLRGRLKRVTDSVVHLYSC